MALMCLSFERGENASVKLAPREHAIHIRPWREAWRNWIPFETTLTVAAQEERQFTIRCAPGGFFRKNTIELHARQWRDQIRSGNRSVSAPDINWSNYKFQVFETSLIQEEAGQTSFVGDNTGSPVALTRATRVENELTRTIVIGGSSTETKGIAAGLQVGWIAVKAKIESMVTTQYSIQQDERRQISHEVVISVPPRSRVEVIVSWKRVWQNGFVRITDRDRLATDVPFRFVDNLDFDRHYLSN
jgi:hypothetical protein